MRKRCQLCGGKLVNNICTECGLDNSKNDSNYTTNHYHCQDEPLTHAHSNEENAYSGKTMTDEQRQQIREERKAAKKNRIQRGQVPRTKGKRSVPRVIMIVVVLWIALGFMGTLVHTLSSVFHSFTEEQMVDDYDPYWNEQNPIPEEGEYFSVDLSSGYVRGGIHIPEGIYTVELIQGSSGFSLNDRENSIFMYYSSDEVAETVTNLHVHNGGLITISGDVVLRFTTENAQPLLPTEANENTETFRMTQGMELVGGESLPIGSYDVTCIEGYGAFYYEYLDSNNQLCQDTIYLDADGEYDAFQFSNLVIQDGMKISVSEDSEFAIDLVPSLVVGTDGYEDYYHGL